jgi:3-isopropylmalate/(R)-2-methylmalate dehydratase small subunit
METFSIVESTAVLLPADDIDTDQIIPARFLTTTTRRGLGAHLFADWRYGTAGALRADFPLNAPGASAARILVAGRNFGCGSSREHAPWALSDFGFRVVVSTSFADIFRNNALKNGLLPVALDATHHAALVHSLARDAGTRLRVDLVARTLAISGGEAWPFPISPFARRCLLDGVDQLAFLVAADAELTAHEQVHPSLIRTTHDAHA